MGGCRYYPNLPGIKCGGYKWTLQQDAQHRTVRRTQSRIPAASECHLHSTGHVAFKWTATYSVRIWTQRTYNGAQKHWSRGVVVLVCSPGSSGRRIGSVVADSLSSKYSNIVLPCLVAWEWSLIYKAGFPSNATQALWCKWNLISIILYFMACLHATDWQRAKRHTPSSLAAVFGLSNNDVISLRSLRCVRCVGWKPRLSPSFCRQYTSAYCVIFCRTGAKYSIRIAYRQRSVKRYGGHIHAI